MAQDLGGIYYEVDLETKGLMDSVKRAKGGLDSLGSSTSGLSNGLDKAGRSASSTASSFSGLSRVAASLMAILSVQQVAQYADAWTTLNNKLSNAIRPNQQLADVTETVFNITQQTRSSLEATATLYSRLERATRSYGASASELAKLTTIINQGFIVSGATAQEAKNAVIQLSQGLASGALRGQEFNSVNEQGNRLIVALADSMGVTVGKMRELAAQGKLTTDVVVKGLLSQGDAIGKEFANTTTTISQALEVAGNNITKFFGENSTVKSGVATFNSSIVSISENIDVLGVALTGVAAIMGSRYVGALTMAAQAKVSGVTATIRQQKAEYDNAKATIASAQAEIKNSQAIIASEQAKARQLATQAAINKQYGLAVSYQAEYAAIQKNIVAADNAAAAAKARLAAATQQASVANRVYAASATLLKGALSFIGGPAGAAMLAASAIFYFWQQAKQAKEESINFADSLDGVIAKMREMNQVQLQGTLADIAKSITAQKEKIDDLNDSVSDAQREYEKYIGLARKFGVEQDQTNGYVQKANEWFYTLSQRKRDLSDATDKLNKTQHQQAEIQEQLNTKAKESDAAFDVLANNLRTKIPNASEAAIAAMAATMQSLDSLNKKASESGKAAEPEPSSEAKKLIQNAERRLALSKLEGEARARLQAQYDAEDVGLAANDPVTKQLQDRYAQTEKNTKAQKEANSESKKSASQADSVNQKLDDLKNKSQLAAESAKDLNREQAILNAQLSLGKGATEAQKKQAGDYAAEIWDTANALKAQAAAEKLIPERQESTRYTQETKDLKTALDAKKITQDEFNQATERAEQQHQSNLAKIRSDAVVSPINDARGSIDPVQQLQNENARKLALIQQFETEKGAITERGIALMTAANKQYEQERTAAQWEIWRQQSLGNEAAAAAFDSFAGNASNALTGIITGSMSAEDALRSIGSNALNSLVNTFVQMGVEWVKSAIMGQAAQTAAIGTVTAVQTAAVATQTATSTAAAATTAAAWTPAAILSSVASMGTAAAIGLGAVAGVVGANLLGKRKNGGPVTAGGMYQVGEGGMPEIYQASTGKQYMIPGDNGKVISNKDMTAVGGGGVVINIQNYTSSSVDAQAGTDGNGGLTVDVIVADLNNGGPISNAITSNMNVKRTPRGQG
ncbi:tape measure protein [Enterobacter sp. Ap-916]|uniref:tape measure protein n=1 Tax=unclassified Enterobacter TaxID=2608935 RepID=UPI001420E0B5|nr:MULTISPECIES: tape measure protein [unclassified Enterobacter]NIF57541.1 tape measure protein [Enterobacter sp. Ap-867]NIG28516.1 tape measure protein [Enterobacter sp. Ap-916]